MDSRFIAVLNKYNKKISTIVNEGHRSVEALAMKERCRQTLQQTKILQRQSSASSTSPANIKY